MKKRGIGFWIGFVFVLLVMLALIELNKNTLLGFVLVPLAAAIFVWLHGRARGKGKRALCWLGFFALFALVLFLTKPPVRAVPAAEGGDTVLSPVVETKNGSVQGVISADGAVEVFAGIPYAKPPVGELRWREPQDPEPWSGTLICDHFAPQSMQPVDSTIYSSLARIVGYHDYEITLEDNYITPVSEDSLYVNVWKPSGEVGGLPVYVFIHGGSLQTGQPWYGDYSGEGLAKEGVIVVNMGYRLGVFGFFASEELAAESEHGTTGNYGLLDQIKALEWVQSNISAFGGDPDNVTVAGESAGAACVSALCTSPLAKGLFRRAILESSTVASKNPPHSYRRYDEAIESGKALMEKYGCSTLAELRALPAEKLVGEASTQHHITVDGYVLIEDPYESYRKGVHNEEALLHGYNSEESGPFILFGQANLKTFEGKVRAYFKDNADEVLAAYPVSTDAEAKKAWAEIWGAAFFDYSHYCLNRLAADNGIPVWQYRFSKHNGRLGPWHSGEEVYFYGNIPEDSKLFDERDRELGRQMLGYFVNFIKTGDPNGNGLPLWEENSSSVDLMEFGDSTRMIKEDKLPLYSALDKMDGWE